MAGTIKTGPITPEYAANYERAMRRVPFKKDDPRPPGVEPCGNCGRVMRYADQRCACTLKRGR